jgi:hypothetical protein
MGTPEPDEFAHRADYDQWRQSLDWEQGEHFTLIGPTGSGKSTLAVDDLLPRRDYVIALVTKRKDPVVWDLRNRGYDVFRDWQDIPHEVSPRRVIAPPSNGVRDLGGQQEAFASALSAAYRQGGWTVYLDEMRYVTDFLGLARDCELLWHQGRSEGTTVLAGAQRPRHAPLVAYSQATHVAFWKTNDDQDIRRMSEIGGVDRHRLAEVVPSLEWQSLKHLGGKYRKRKAVRAEVLHINTREGEVTRSLPPVKKFK